MCELEATHTPLTDSRDLLDKLRLSQLVKKYPKFYATQRFVNVFTNNAWHLVPHSGRVCE